MSSENGELKQTDFRSSINAVFPYWEQNETNRWEKNVAYRRMIQLEYEV